MEEPKDENTERAALCSTDWLGVLATELHIQAGVLYGRAERTQEPADRAAANVLHAIAEAVTSTAEKHS